MNGQGNLFDAQEGERRKQEALERVEEGARNWIEDYALPAIRGCALRKDTFTTDDVWGQLAVVGAPLPREHRAMGAAMRKGKAERLIVPAGPWIQSKRPECNRRDIRVWKSLARGCVG